MCNKEECQKGILNKYKGLPVPLKAALWFLVCSVLQKGISTITTPIFTRLLTTEEYGNYSVFNSWLSIITVIITLSLTNGVNVQGLIKYSESRDIFLSSLQGLTLVLTISWTAIYVLFRGFWNQLLSLTTVQMFALLIIAWSTTVFEIWSGEQRVKFSYKRLVVISVLVAIAKPAVGIFFVLKAEDKVTARILGIALVQIVAYTGLFISQIYRGRKFFDAHFWKYAILYSLPLVPQTLAEIVLNSSDRIMISKMIGDSEAGIYNLAYSISLIMTIFNTAIQQTMNPWIYQRLKEKRTANISSVATFSLTIIAVSNLALIAVAPEAVRLFAPVSYYEAVWIIPPICMSVVGMFLCGLFCKLEFYYEKTHFVMIASLSAAVINIVLNYIFIARFGYFAAAYTTLICFFADAAGHYIFMRSISKKYLNGAQIYNMKALLGITVGFMVTAVAFMCLYNFIAARYMLLAVVGIVVLLNYKRILKKIKLLLTPNRE